MKYVYCNPCFDTEPTVNSLQCWVASACTDMTFDIVHDIVYDIYDIVDDIQAFSIS